MEPASFGLLFACFGAGAVFCGAKWYAGKRWGARTGEPENAENAAIDAAYARLALVRTTAFLLGLTALGLWILEPKPHAAGAAAALSCLCLWRAWRLRGGIVERLRVEGERHAIIPSRGEGNNPT